MARSRLLLLGLASLSVLFGGLHCSAEEASRDSGAEDPIAQSDPRDKMKLGNENTLGAGGGSSSLHPLCGTSDVEACIPEDPTSCADYEPPAGSGGAPVNVAGAAGADDGIDFGGAAGAVGYGGQAGEIDVPSETGTLGSVGFACHVRRDEDGPYRDCRSAGQKERDELCLSPSDCRAGLTCVGDGTSGICAPYCCEGAGSCGADRYCAERAVVGSDPDLKAPVCVRVDPCNLAEPHPCPDGVECQCTGTLACMLIKGDQESVLSGCVEPGEGVEGDTCEAGAPGGCAAGHVCSASGVCRKLCRTLAEENECGEGRHCLARFQGGFGVCTESDGSQTSAL